VVCHGVMSRTNIDIDDELIERVMRRRDGGGRLER
jgi:Arc/MetJ family transcription regulator